MEVVIPPRCVDLVLNFHRTNLTGIDEFEAAVFKEFEDMKPHLPEDVSNILEIGPGIGLMAVYLARFYKDAALTLVDYDQVDALDQKCNSYELLIEFLATNGVRNFTITDTIPDGPFGLCVSTLSWGFHYPLSTYLDRVLKVCHGPIIVDVRKDKEVPGIVIGRYGHKGKARRMILDRDCLLPR